MKNLPPKALKYLKLLHLLCAIMWAGGAMALFVVLCSTRPSSPEACYIRSLCARRIDDFLIIPGAVAITLTGVVYGVWTNWGFFKHRWLAVKWALTMALILVGTFVVGPWVNGNVHAPEDIGDYAAHPEAFARNVALTIRWGAVLLAGLLFVVWVSVAKPWAKRK